MSFCENALGNTLQVCCGNWVLLLYYIINVIHSKVSDYESDSSAGLELEKSYNQCFFVVLIYCLFNTSSIWLTAVRYVLKCCFLDGKAITVENIDNTQYALKDLVPGATYQVQAFTVFENKESAAYTSRNFTTSMLFDKINNRWLMVVYYRTKYPW